MSQQLLRIRWHCRRGMLELDQLLNHFVSYHLHDFSPAEQDVLLSLLTYSDLLLYSWIFQQFPANNRDLQAIIEWIRYDATFLLKAFLPIR
jgi:antitoxin CptB